MNKKYIVANWKNHPNYLAEAKQILDLVDEFLGSLSESEKFSLIFCPPFVFTEEVGKILKTSHLMHQSELGAQNISVNDNTALTGEISGLMLQKLGVRYIIIGHSERRWKLGESDETVNKKLKSALKNELIPIVCIGEKDRGKDYSKFLENQVIQTFKDLDSDEINKCIIAYEPVWAVSTTPSAKPDTPESALESIRIINETLKAKRQALNGMYLYGGSITSANAREFLICDDFNGVLVGGASVDKEEFIKILSIANKL